MDIEVSVLDDDYNVGYMIFKTLNKLPIVDFNKLKFEGKKLPEYWVDVKHQVLYVNHYGVTAYDITLHYQEGIGRINPNKKKSSSIFNYILNYLIAVVITGVGLELTKNHSTLNEYLYFGFATTIYNLITLLRKPSN